MQQYLALIYDQWRSTRMFFMVAIAIGLIPCLGTYLFLMGRDDHLESEYNLYKFYAIGGLRVAHLFWLFILLSASDDDDDLKLTLPFYLMRLPVRAWKLVAARMSFGVMSNLVLAIAGTSLYYALFDETMEQALPFFSLFIAFATAYIVFQPVVWWVGPAGLVPTIIALVAVAVGIPWSVTTVGDFWGFDVETAHFFGNLFSKLGAIFTLLISFIVGNHLQFNPRELDDYAAIGIAVTALLSFVVALAAVAQHRKGRFRGIAVPKVVRRRIRSGESDISQTFASKSEALRWFQSRHQFNLYPKILIAMFTGVLFLILAFIFLNYRRNDSSPPSIQEIWDNFGGNAISSILVSVFLGTILSGIVLLFRGWRSLYGRDGIFLFVRPATTMELATARWESSVRAIVIGLLPLFGVALGVSFLDVQRLPDGAGETTTIGNLMSFHSVHLGLLLGAAAVLYGCAVIWAVLWLENILGMFILGASVFIPITSLSALMVARSDFVELYPYRIAGLVIFTVLSLFFIFDYRNQLVSVKHLLTVFVLAPIVAIGYLAVTNQQAIWNQEPLGKIHLMQLTTIFPFIMMVVLAPVITGPAIVHWARHKG